MANVRAALPQPGPLRQPRPAQCARGPNGCVWRSMVDREPSYDDDDDGYGEEEEDGEAESPDEE